MPFRPRSVVMMIVDRDNFTASKVGFAPSGKAMLRLCYPDLPEESYQDEEVIKMLDEVDNVTGTLFVLDPVEGLPLVANSTLEKLIKEVTDA